jgi:hypothetical protein
MEIFYTTRLRRQPDILQSNIIGSQEPDKYKVCLGTMICSHGLLQNIKAKIQVFITDSTAARQLEKEIT